MSDLEPVDLTRCQGERRSYNAWVMGGSPYKVERCTNVPSHIATEKQPGKDGQAGSMSLCQTCIVEFEKQLGADYATLTPIGDIPSQCEEGA